MNVAYSMWVDTVRGDSAVVDRMLYEGVAERMEP